MIASLNGKITYSDSKSVVIECAGVGLRCFCSLNTLASLPKIGDSAFLFTHMSVKEDAIDLYGFASADELASADGLAARVIPAGTDLTPLTHESELALMRKMDDFSELIELAARDRAPFRLTHYAQQLAGLFHQFYTNCHIIGEDAAVQNARLALADATRILLALTLSLLGVSAPERM